jgi:hypothetical protein
MINGGASTFTTPVKPSQQYGLFGQGFRGFASQPGGPAAQIMPQGQSVGGKVPMVGQPNIVPGPGQNPPPSPQHPQGGAMDFAAQAMGPMAWSAMQQGFKQPGGPGQVDPAMLMQIYKMFAGG